MRQTLLSCEIAQCVKTLIAIFQEFSASIKKSLVLGEDWVLRYNYMKISDFTDLTDLSKFPKILSLKFFGNS